MEISRSPNNFFVPKLFDIAGTEYTCDTEENGTTTCTVGMEENLHDIMDSMATSLAGVENWHQISQRRQIFTDI